MALQNRSRWLQLIYLTMVLAALLMFVVIMKRNG